MAANITTSIEYEKARPGCSVGQALEPWAQNVDPIGSKSGFVFENPGPCTVL